MTTLTLDTAAPIPELATISFLGNTDKKVTLCFSAHMGHTTGQTHKFRGLVIRRGPSNTHIDVDKTCETHWEALTVILGERTVSIIRKHVTSTSRLGQLTMSRTHLNQSLYYLAGIVEVF